MEVGRNEYVQDKFDATSVNDTTLLYLRVIMAHLTIILVVQTA
jgi:hypothetical protein